MPATTVRAWSALGVERAGEKLPLARREGLIWTPADDGGVEGGLSPAVAVKQQRILGSAGDRPITSPGLAVVDTPEGDAADLLAVLSEDSASNRPSAAGESWP